jgi:uncharacterized protein
MLMVLMSASVQTSSNVNKGTLTDIPRSWQVSLKIKITAMTRTLMSKSASCSCSREQLAVDQNQRAFITEPTKHIIPASHGYAAALKAGTSFRLIDMHGQQVIDMSAFVLPFTHNSITSAEHLSTSYTNYHLRGQPLAVGDAVYTNMDRPLLRLSHDVVHTNDLTFMSCFPKLYLDSGFKPGEHRSCTENMLESFKPWGMKHLTEVRDPCNVFQNTPAYTLKPLNASRKGDWIQFDVLIDCVVGWSCCPYDLNGFNGGKVTEVVVVMGLEPGDLRTNDQLLEAICTAK